MITIDNVKRFWDKRPCNIRHSKKEVGTLEYFEDVSKKKFFVEPHIKSFTNFSSWKNKKVIEIGCGIGTAGIEFAKAGADYTGVELSNESLALTKQRFDIYSKAAKFYSGNAEELSTFVPVETYDLIYSFGVIHHSPSPEKIISEIKKYMNNKSILKIMLYAKNSWKNYMIEAGFDQPEAQTGCPIANVYSTEQVKQLLMDYEIISIKQDHIFPYKIKEYKNDIYIKQPWFESMSADMFKALESKLGWHLLITAKLK